MNPVDMERAALATELTEVAARLLRDTSSLTRAASWLAGNNGDFSLGRIGTVLHRYAYEHKQACHALVRPIADRVGALGKVETEGQKARGKTVKRAKAPAVEAGGVIYLSSRRPRLADGHARWQDQPREAVIWWMSVIKALCAFRADVEMEIHMKSGKFGLVLRRTFLMVMIGGSLAGCNGGYGSSNGYYGRNYYGSDYNYGYGNNYGNWNGGGRNGGGNQNNQWKSIAPKNSGNGG